VGVNDGPGDDGRRVVRSWLSSIIRRHGIDSRRRGGDRTTLHPISVALTPLHDVIGEPWEWAGRSGAGVEARVTPHHPSPDRQRDGVRVAVAGIADDGIVPAFEEYADRAPSPPGSNAHETERVYALYTDMTCGLIVLNRRGELVDANDAAQRILGVRLDEMRGQPSSVALWRAIDADGVNGADPHEGEKLIGTALRARRPMRATMVHATRPDGRSRWLQVDAVPVREDGDGSPGDGQGLVVVSFIDITAQREATEILRVRAECATLQNTAAAILATSAALRDAVPPLLQAICDGAGWEVGRFWSVDSRDNVLRCTALWRRPSSEGAGFAALAPGTTCAPGIGVPGRVWADGVPAWVAGMGAATPGSGVPLVTVEGLYGTIGIPVPIAGAVQGVMEFVRRDIRPPHADLVGALVAIGAHIGQFMERKRAEEALRRQALHDALTGLPNRALLHDRLEQALRVAGRDNYAANRSAVRPGGNLAVYAAPDGHSPDRQALGDELRHAIAHDGLLLHYQPTVDIATGDSLAVCRREAGSPSCP